MKKEIKYILIIFCCFFLFAIIGMFSFISSAFDGFNGIKKTVEVLNNQQKNIGKVNDLKCKIVSDNTISTPMNSELASVYFIRVGHQVWVNESTTGIRKRNASYKKEWITNDYDYVMIVGSANGTKLSINDTLYNIDFSQCILWAHTGGVLLPPVIASERRKTLDNDTKNKLYKLKDKHPWIKIYFKKHGYLDDLIIQEIVLKHGDSVYIKGEIKNNQIKPFLEHHLAVSIE